MRQVDVINHYVKITYMPNSINRFKQNCYSKLLYSLSYFSFTINSETNIQYNNMLHIYAFIRSQALTSYPEISLEDIIYNKCINQIPITIDEYIGLYVYSINQHLINSLHYQLLLKEYDAKAYVQSKLMDKIRFKLLLQDYEQNPGEYQNNRLDKLLGNTDFARYFTTFIFTN